MSYTIKPRDFTPEHVKGNSKRRAGLYLSPSWMGNGLWMVRKEFLDKPIQVFVQTKENAEIWLDGEVQMVKDADVERYFQVKERWKVTPWVFELRPGKLARFVQHEDGRALLDLRWCDLLKIRAGDTVHGPVPTKGGLVVGTNGKSRWEPAGDASEAFTDALGTACPEWVLMPMALAEDWKPESPKVVF